MQPLLLLASTALAAGRTRLRSEWMYEYTQNIDCSTATSQLPPSLQGDAACVQKCTSSPYCAKRGFDVESWRKCLIDLGPTCQMKPEVFLGQPISGSTTYSEVSNNAVQINAVSKFPTDAQQVLYRWAVPESIAQECTTQDRWVIKGNSASDSDLLTAEIVRDWRGRPYLVVVVTDVTKVNPSKQQLTDILSDEAEKSRCLYDEAGHFYGVGAFAYNPANLIMPGARVSKTFHVPLKVRDEWYIGAVPKLFYDA